MDKAFSWSIMQGGNAQVALVRIGGQAPFLFPFFSRTPESRATNQGGTALSAPADSFRQGFFYGMNSEEREVTSMSMGKWMKKAVMALMVAGAVLAVSGCGGGQKASSKPMEGAKVAKIGFATASTGPVAAYGLGEKEGFDMAVEEINKGGKIHFEVNEMDTKGQVSQAVNVIQKMISQKEAVIVGPVLSSEYKAIGKLVEQAKIPTIGVAVTAEGVTDGYDYLFRVCVPESENIPNTVKKTHQKLGYKRVAILYSSNNEHQVSAYNVFKRSLEAEGVEIIATETFADKDTDFSAQLTKIQPMNPDVVILAAYYQEGALILKKMRAMGMNQPVLGDNGFASPELMKLAGEASNNTYVSSMWAPDRKSQLTETFVADFKKKYNKDPDQFAACGYLAVKYVAEAMDKAGTTTDTKKIREAMANIKNMETVAGPMSFANKGTPEVDLVLLEVKDGKFTLAK